MAINWTERRGLAKALAAAGFAKNHIDDVCHISTDLGLSSPEIDDAAQAIIDAYDELPTLRAEKIEELKIEGLRRIQVVFPAVPDFDFIDLEKERWLSIAPASRQATPNYQLMIDIHGVGKNIATAINASTDAAAITAYDVVNSPNWP